MLKSPHIFFLLCWLCGGAIRAQDISFAYENESLAVVLEELKTDYAVRFAYSPNRLPMDYPITAQAQQVPVAEGVEILFDNTPIHYAFIGDLIALRADPGMLSQLEQKPKPPRQATPLYQDPRPTPPPIQIITSSPPPREVNSGQRWDQEQSADEELERMHQAIARHQQELQIEKYDATHRLAQVSLLPYLGTNTYRSDEVTNNISINLLFGTNKAVDGLEMGVVGNRIVEDVRGLQMAGVVNVVGGNVTGTQLSGGVNITRGKIVGAQIAGLANYSRDSLIGAQVATFYNINRHHVAGTQTASLFNVCDGDIRVQTSALYNRARYVERRQVGLVNVCDTTGKAPIGLLNVVKYGYNRVEVGSSESLYLTLGGKFGVRQLYNIVQVGARWDQVNMPINGIDQEAVYMTWSLGYGLGLAPQLGKKTSMNLELLASHVNELESWTDELNILTQLRINFDFQLGRRLSCYAGPTVNWMRSRRYEAATETYGSRLPFEPLWERERNGLIDYGWIGFSAGLRM